MANKSSLSTLVWILILLAAAGGGTYWWLHRDGGKTPVEFRTVKATKGDITQAVTASGQVNPLLNVQVGSQVSGIIQKLYADFNSEVTNGQLLAELDPSTFKATVAQSQGNLDNAEASLTLAKVNARRAEELIAKNLISQSDYDKTKADLQLAEAQVAIRRAQLRKDQVDLERASIYSPIDGVVISRNMDIGQTLAASFNAPVLFQIANDLHEMQIHAAVSEADIGGIKTGQDVSFTVDAYSGRTFKGTVSQVRYAATTNQNVVTYDTVIGVKNSDLDLRPGMTATVSIITAKQRDIVKVPNSALRFRPPEGAPIKGGADAGSAAAGSNAVAKASAPAADDGPSFDSLPDQFKQRALAKFDKNGDGKLEGEELAAWREEMKKRAASGGGPGGRGGSRSGGAPTTRTLYLVETVEGPGGSKTQQLSPVQVKLGISDGTTTEVKEGLKEGDEVAMGVALPAAAAPASAAAGGSAPVNPFAPRMPMGGPPRRP